MSNQKFKKARHFYLKMSILEANSKRPSFLLQIFVEVLLESNQFCFRILSSKIFKLLFDIIKLEKIKSEILASLERFGLFLKPMGT
jgi:hypothetical protein